MHCPAFLKVLGAIPVLLLASCATGLQSGDDPGLQHDLDGEHTYQSETGYSYWDNRPGDGPMRVTVDLSEQTAYFFKGTVPVGKSRVATGLPGHRTPTGSFTVMEKVVDKRSTLYGRIVSSTGEVLVSEADIRRDEVPPGGRFVGAAMPYWMRLNSSGIGMHVGPIPNPGLPASHGCIRMPKTMAQILYANVSVGTPVKVVR
ncbi:L,D-transpeptidase [Luteolibacter marinus]|uniref:L,D-transpeptidase n=1 Tax=Luteolibacter marinus TaxID=2776705 RepID=UPI001D034150|nr:L,D-transpeptidase [Luteolibacter marinus]